LVAQFLVSGPLRYTMTAQPCSCALVDLHTVIAALRSWKTSSASA
jgi:hypothetical protein